MTIFDSLFLGIAFLILPQNAHAYIDAGTGSYIIQIFLAIAVGGLYSIKIYWKKLTGFFRQSSNKEEEYREKP